MRTCFLVTLCACLFFPPLLVQCQNARVAWYAFDAGFGLPASSTTSAPSAIGQIFVGPALGGNTQILSGFLGDTLLRSPVVSVDEQPPLPLSFALLQNFPNPFNPTTTISYQLAAASLVSLTVYDLLGREVALLVNEQKGPGRYSVQFNARSLASGVYVYRMTAGGFRDSKKLILLK